MSGSHGFEYEDDRFLGYSAALMEAVRTSDTSVYLSETTTTTTTTTTTFPFPFVPLQRPGCLVAPLFL
jgi:hypothetical protein